MPFQTEYIWKCFYHGQKIKDVTVAVERELQSVLTFNTLSYYQPVQEKLKQIWFKLLAVKIFLSNFLKVCVILES